MEREVKVDLLKLPNIGDLNIKVNAIVNKSTWFEKYGVDWLHVVGTIPTSIFALWCLTHDLFEEPFKVLLGIFLLGCYHSVFANKCGHLAAHGAMAESKSLNNILCHFFVEFVGSFSKHMAYDIHVKSHHPHTNIIGLGDSSTWRAPFVPRYLYMFVTPLTVPILVILVSIAELLRQKQYIEFLKYCFIASSGLFLQVGILMKVCGFSFWTGLLCLFTCRAVLAIPYIHINIFQHIGLPMYSQKNRPKKIYQMSTGCLNISRNLLLDVTFGHGIISCHVEHHLYPKLSDYMCLKIKPVVSKFLTENNLPYNEDDYMSRLKIFIDNYEELMVKAPPITHFVGLQ